jgi:hypothetical protein
MTGSLEHTGARSSAKVSAPEVPVPLTRETPVLILLAAGKGTRFGTEPKCIQPVAGVPLSRHTIDAFEPISPYPAVCVVGYRHEEVRSALGEKNIYVISDNPVGGTAYAVWEALSFESLLAHDPLLVITMGDRVVPTTVFDRLICTHCAQGEEPELTFLSAVYPPPQNKGRGRILRCSETGAVERIIEQKDIDGEPDRTSRASWESITECNCPLYVVRARTLARALAGISNTNAQNQYYLTDIIEVFRRLGGEIRTVTISPSEPVWDLLSSDVTRPDDLALLEGTLTEVGGREQILRSPADEAAEILVKGRCSGQILSIARQLEQLYQAEYGAVAVHRPLAVGVCGGRLRIAFMHPDMERFYGPAWQMPIGAAEEQGEEQITVIVQETDDNRLHVRPLNGLYREQVESLPADEAFHYPAEEIDSAAAYEPFGTRLSENLLLSMGYFSDEELKTRSSRGLPLPPATLWASSNMRRPFTLVANAIASMRTLRRGVLAERIRLSLGAGTFSGLRTAAAGSIPQGGFSSSSALTVAVKNAVNCLYDLRIPEDLLIHLACQAEYGTGVRAGSLDQATEQKGVYGVGTLISSNPRDNYAVLGSFPVPRDRYAILYPYSAARDREAWKWSWGFYGPGGDSPIPTAGEYRKMTGKAAAIAAVLTGLPEETDFFKVIEPELLQTGSLSESSCSWISALLLQLPLGIDKATLREAVLNRLREADPSALTSAEHLFTRDWRTPLLPTEIREGRMHYQSGVPLRSMIAYLFAEMVRGFCLLHHQDEWIRCVTRSQQGDRSLTIDPEALPERQQLVSPRGWETGYEGPQLLDQWLRRAEAVPFNSSEGLHDEDLRKPADFLTVRGGSFFRGLALIDLAEAMLKRAFGEDAVAVRVNAAGQGDYFQVHVDRELADVEEVKQFVRKAFYARFSLNPPAEFVELHPGGGAAGVRLERADYAMQVVQRMRRLAREQVQQNP